METLQRKRRNRPQRGLSESLIPAKEKVVGSAGDSSTDDSSTDDFQEHPIVITTPLDVHQDHLALLDWRIVTAFTLVGTLLLFLF